MGWALVALEEGSHAIGLWIGQALQHQGIHDGEDRGVGSDGERKCNDHRDGECAIADQLANGEAKILT